MGVADDQDGYGFARRSMPPRKKIGRRAAAPAGPPPTGSTRLPHHPTYSEDYGPRSKKSALVWLLIGILLGTGGTLMAASFWLPDGGNREVARLDANADGRTLPVQETASELQPTETEGETAVAKKVPETSAADDVSASPQISPAKAASAEVAAPDIDKAANGSAATSTIVSNIVPPEPARSDEKPEAEGSNEQLLPVPDDVIADIERRPADTSSPDVLSDPETALADLVSESVSPPTPPPQQRLETTATDTSSAAAARGQPTPSPASASATAAVDDQLSPPNDPADSVPTDSVNASTRSTTKPQDTASTKAAESAELPPRIRQALAKAGITPNVADTRNGQRLYRVQLAAVDNESAARIYWREVNTRLPGVFTDVEPIFDQRVVDQRSYLRIWVGAFDNLRDADGYCGWLKQQGQDCFVTRVDNL